MRAASARYRMVVTTCLAAALLWPGTAARAEVGTVWDPEGGSPPSTLYELMIIDDIDPVPRAWLPVGSPTAGRAVLNPQGDANGDGRPSLHYDLKTGIPLVAWAMATPEGYDVVLSRFEQGAWTAPQPLADGPGDQFDPFLAADPADGTVHLVYASDGPVPGVFHRQAPASDPSAWSAPQQLSLPGEIALRPAATVWEGQLLVVWEAHDGGAGTTPRRIVMASVAGGQVTLETVVTTWHAEPNWPQVHARPDRIWLEWIDAEGQMGWTRQLQPGSWEALDTEIFETLEELEYHVRGEVRSQALD